MNEKKPTKLNKDMEGIGPNGQVSSLKSKKVIYGTAAAVQKEAHYKKVHNIKLEEGLKRMERGDMNQKITEDNENSENSENDEDKAQPPVEESRRYITLSKLAKETESFKKFGLKVRDSFLQCDTEDSIRLKKEEIMLDISKRKTELMEIRDFSKNEIIDIQEGLFIEQLNVLFNERLEQIKIDLVTMVSMESISEVFEDNQESENLDSLDEYSKMKSQKDKKNDLESMESISEDFEDNQESENLDSWDEYTEMKNQKDRKSESVKKTTLPETEDSNQNDVEPSVTDERVNQNMENIAENNKEETKDLSESYIEEKKLDSPGENMDEEWPEEESTPKEINSVKELDEDSDDTTRESTDFNPDQSKLTDLQKEYSDVIDKLKMAQKEGLSPEEEKELEEKAEEIQVELEKYEKNIGLKSTLSMDMKEEIKKVKRDNDIEKKEALKKEQEEDVLAGEEYKKYMDLKEKYNNIMKKVENPGDFSETGMDSENMDFFKQQAKEIWKQMEEIKNSDNWVGYDPTTEKGKNFRKKEREYKKKEERLEKKKSNWKEGVTVFAGLGLAAAFLYKLSPYYLWYRFIVKPEFTKASGKK